MSPKRFALHVFVQKGTLHRVAVLLCLALCLQAGILGASRAGETLSVRARWVADGDTLILKSGETLRLKGVDAPELGRDGGPDQFHARQSRDGLAGLVEGTVLRLELDGQPQDRYGRLLAWVRLPGGRLLQEVLLEQGLVFVYPHPEDSSAHDSQLLLAQHRAMDHRQGFWGRLLTLPRAGEVFLGNSRSLRFHTWDCPNAKRMSRRNTVRFSGLGAAFRAGYAPARCCTPWPPGR